MKAILDDYQGSVSVQRSDRYKESDDNTCSLINRLGLVRRIDMNSDVFFKEMIVGHLLKVTSAGKIFKI